MTLPPSRIGDKGQRYTVVFKGFHEDAPDVEQALGYSVTLKGAEDLTEIVKAHPEWHSPRIVDREVEEEE